MNRPPPAILILAAGASTRMRGDDKLLEDIDGTPLILRAARAACAVSTEVLIALPASDRSRRAWLTDLPARVLDVEDRAMSASIRVGAAACRADALTIHLADMPDIRATEFDMISRAWQAGSAPILRATDSDGTPGQPITFARALFPELLALRGDTGARALLTRHPVETVALPGRAATTDLDTPEAWADWRANRAG